MQSGPSDSDSSEMPLHHGGSKRVLIIESPYYAAVTRELREGATAVLAGHGVPYERISVPGALEIPQAFRAAVSNGKFAQGSELNYGGIIALGCVIRGETSHYDIVCNNANHWLMATAIENSIPVGNGILTVDTEAQAMARARGGAAGKGGDAARACLRLLWLNTHFEKQNV